MTRRLTQAGLSVPGDVAIAGYDDIDLAAEATIPLTSMGQPKYSLGHRAAELVLAEINADAGRRHERAVFPSQLTVRESSRR